MARCVRVGAHEGDAPPGVLRVTRPDLLALEDPPALGGGGPGGERGQVRTGTGLAEQLAPDLPGVQDGRQPAVTLGVVPVGQKCRADEVDPGAVDGLGSP